MASALDDDPGIDPLATQEPAPAPPPVVVVGAPEPGGKQSYEPAPTSPTAGPPGPVGARSALDDDPGIDPTAAAASTPESLDASHPLFGQEPGHYVPGQSPTFWHHVFGQLPIVGDPFHKLINDFNAHDRAAELGIPQPQALAEIEGEQKAGTKAHPAWAKTGDVIGDAGGLAAMAALAPELFGASETTKTAGAAMGATSNFLIKSIDDWVRGKPSDPTELALTGVGGALGGAFSAGVKRLFDATIQPGVEELARKAIVDHKIPLPAGLVSANPFLARLPGQLLSGRSGARAIDAWHKAITATIGSDAPRLTARVLGDATKRIGDRMRVLSKLPPGPGTQWATDEMAHLAEQAKNVRALEGVTKIDRFGRFGPEQFHDAVAEALGTDFTKGDNALADLASIGTTFLKGAPAPGFDRATAMHLLKQGASMILPAAGHHLAMHGLSMPTLTTAGISAGVVGGLKVFGKVLSGLVGGVAARSPKIANALIGQSTPLALVPPAVGLAKPVVPGLIQQAVPLAERTFFPGSVPPPRQVITKTREDVFPSGPQ